MLTYDGHFVDTMNVKTIRCILILIVCELPIRSPDKLQVFHKHFKRMHPHMKVPYETDVTGFFPGKQEKHQTREVCI